MKSINISQKHWKIIKEEFPDCHRQTIYGALKYFINSELAIAIRQRALELLQQEITDNQPIN